MSGGDRGGARAGGRGPRGRRAPRRARALLAVDVGNTEVVVGVFHEGRLDRSWRFRTVAGETADEWLLRLLGLAERANVAGFLGSAVASVVPGITPSLVEALTAATGRRPLVVSHKIRMPIRLAVESPAEVGADRIANAAGAFVRHGGPALVVDLGTATTFDLVDARGRYLGGAIAPGMIVSSEELVRRAARLFRVELTPPARAIGRNTTQSLRSGIVWGTVAQIDGLVRRLAAEWGTRPLVIATGGLSTVLGPYCRTVRLIEPDLTLEGIRILFEGRRGG